MTRTAIARIVAACVFALSFVHAGAARAASLPPSPGAPAASFVVGDLHVDRYGDAGPAVVLIPGLGAGPWEWYGLIPHLATTHRVYAVTLPGFDGTTPPADPGHLFSSTDRELAALIAREHLDRPALIGHDLGGMIAIAFAENRPRVPGAVVSIDGPPVALNLAYLSDAERQQQADYGAAAATRDPTMIRQIALQNVATTGALDSGTTNAVLDRQAGADDTTLAIDMREMLTTDLRPELGRIVAPLLFLVPYDLADDSSPPGVQPPVVRTVAQKLDAYRALFANAKTATLVPISPARHFLMLDQPETVMHTIDAFLAAHHD